MTENTSGWIPVLHPNVIDPPTDGFSFFNHLGGGLSIGEAISGCACPNCPCSRTVDVDWKPENVWEGDECRPVTEKEWGQTAIALPTIELGGEEGEPITHHAPNGKFFTVLDLVAAVVETERQTRGKTEWMGGIDRHHTSFGGMRQVNGNLYRVGWDS